MSPPMNITTTTSSMSGSMYQPNFLPSIGVSSCAQWVWSVSPSSSHGSRTLIRSRLSGSLFWHTMP